MKTLKTICLLLLTVTSVFAQPNPDNLFISGYVLDPNGQAQEGIIICVDGVNQPTFPLDSLCTTTNSNGYYFLEIPNGSTTGPNLVFTLSMEDPCPFAPSWQVATVENQQGTVDVVELDWVTCAAPNSACSVFMTAANDSTNGANGLWTFVANPTGTAPFTYDWWVDGVAYTTQTVTHTFNGGTVGVYVTVTDANGCVSTAADTLFLNGNPNNNCGIQIGSQANPVLGGELLTAYAFGTAPYTYLWSTNETTSQISATQPGVYCVTVTDANGCNSTACHTISNPNCSVQITASVDSSGGSLIYTLTASGGFSSYDWSNGATTQTISVQNLGPNGGYYCVTATDASTGCIATSCDSLFPINPPNCFGYIYGQTYAGSSNQPLEDGVVYLISFDANTNQLSLVDSAVIDSGNHFFFGPLTCGDYLVKAAASVASPYYNNHIPTYYGNSPFWGFAQTVSIGQANTQVVVDVTLIAANNPGGPGFISGDVTQGANKTDPGDPLSGMLVLLFDLSGNAIAYTSTDANGEFEFSNLAYGTYQVYVEAIGIETLPAVITIGPDSPSGSVHILASESLISTGIEEFDFEGAISNVYPNPVGNDASIQIDLENGVMVDVSILDLTGRMISTRTVSVSGGENTVNINASQLKNGYYFLTIQDVDGNFSVTRKFMRVD